MRSGCPWQLKSAGICEAEQHFCVIRHFDCLWHTGLQVTSASPSSKLKPVLIQDIPVSSVFKVAQRVMQGSKGGLDDAKGRAADPPS